MPAPWRALGFTDDRRAPVPEALASPQERFERFVRELEREDPAQFKPPPYRAPEEVRFYFDSTQAPHTHTRSLTLTRIRAHVRQQAAGAKAAAEPQTKRLYVSNFPTAGMTEEGAALFFGQYGEVRALRYLENAVLVDFKTEKAAALLLTQSGKITINGRTLTIARAQKKAEKPVVEELQGE